jgi:serine/threonine protein kinase
MKDDPLIGKQLANFLIERVLGRGGMAQVYYGQDVKLQRPVAIKVIDARYRGKPAYAQRFVKEARAVARWRHENIMQIYYADDQDGLYYYVMEYIDGQDLASVLASCSAEGELISPEDVLRIGHAIANALDYAHQRGIIHRDVKPSNVLVANDGRIVLGDFGLALDMQEGSSGEAFGSPHYIAPEQARRSSDVVPQSDLYSLGIILYEMLTGVVPFDDESPTSVALQHITQPPPSPLKYNPRLGPAVEAVLLRALSKTPKDRFQSGADLLAALEKTLISDSATPPQVLPLPAMPAGVLSGQTPTVVRRSEVLPLPAPRPPQNLLLQTPAAVPRAARSRGKAWILILLLILSAGAALLWFYPGLLPLPFGLIPAATPSATLQPVLAATIMPPPSEISTLAAASSTFTASPQPPSPTASRLIPSQTASATIAPSQTEIASPTVTVAPTLAGMATVKYPAGQRMLLLYDASGFYIFNASSNNRSIAQFDFERLGRDDTVLNTFEGWRWSELFQTLHPNRCMRIEIKKSPLYLRPTQCNDRYLASFSFESAAPEIFWTQNSASSQFRVLWENEEIGRCEIEAGTCEVLIP